MIHVDQPLLDRLKAPGRCEKCGRLVKVLDPHHAFSYRGIAGGMRLDVLWQIALLCGGPDGCHGKAQRSEEGFDRVTILKIVAARQGIDWQDVVSAIYVLRRLRNDACDAAIEHELNGETGGTRLLVWDVAERVRVAAK